MVHIGFHDRTNFGMRVATFFFSKGSQCDKLSVAKTNVHTDVRMHLSVQMVVLSADLRESLFHELEPLIALAYLLCEVVMKPSFNPHGHTATS